MAIPRNAAGSDLVDNPALEISIHLKVLAYDRSVVQRGQDKFMVAILFNSADAASKENATKLQALLGRGGLKVQDQAIEAVAIAYSPSTVGEDLGRVAADAVYVGTGLDDAVDAILKIATTKQLITLTGGLSSVKRGIAVGVYLRSNGRPGIAINLSTARASGMILAPAVLSLATVFE
ncbi:MAG: YfiR family protein [Deltaproteobacteria bacterium]|nr:YfiR family protein [Deltaproteobacteria bacterium]